MNRTEGLDDLATRLSAMVNELPNDGPEQSMVVKVRGDNHGNVTFGNHITINTAAEPQEEERPLTDAELHSIKQQAKHQQRRAWIRSRFNIPTFLMLLILLSMGMTLFSGYLWQVATGQYPWIVSGFGFAFLLTGLWAGRIHHLEQPIIQETQETLEYVRQIQHRRRVM